MKNEPIKFEKSFPVEVSKLYQAWTTEDALKAWWKPAGRTLQSVEANLEDGGTIKYTFVPAANNEGQLVIEGQYETVKPEEQLIYSWNWELENEPVENGAYTLTVDFATDGNGSKLTIAQESAAEQDGIHPHQEGWEKALNELELYLQHK